LARHTYYKNWYWLFTGDDPDVTVTAFFSIDPDVDQLPTAVYCRVAVVQRAEHPVI
jgi:hypothetical protein